MVWDVSHIYIFLKHNRQKGNTMDRGIILYEKIESS